MDLIANSFFLPAKTRPHKLLSNLLLHPFHAIHPSTSTFLFSTHQFSYTFTVHLSFNLFFFSFSYLSLFSSNRRNGSNVGSNETVCSHQTLQVQCRSAYAVMQFIKSISHNMPIVQRLLSNIIILCRLNNSAIIN